MEAERWEEGTLKEGTLAQGPPLAGKDSVTPARIMKAINFVFGKEVNIGMPEFWPPLGYLDQVITPRALGALLSE